MRVRVEKRRERWRVQEGGEGEGGESTREGREDAEATGEGGGGKSTRGDSGKAFCFCKWCLMVRGAKNFGNPLACSKRKQESQVQGRMHHQKNE